MSKPAVEESLWGTASGNVINVGQQPERSGCICLCLWVRQLGDQGIKDMGTRQTECLRPLAKYIHILYMCVCTYVYIFTHIREQDRAICALFVCISAVLSVPVSVWPVLWIYMCTVCMYIQSTLRTPHCWLIYQIQQFATSTFGETWETDNENCENCEEISFWGTNRIKGEKTML